MTTVIIQCPESVFSALRWAPAEFIKEMRIEAATQWYGRYSIGKVWRGIDAVG